MSSKNQFTILSEFSDSQGRKLLNVEYYKNGKVAYGIVPANKKDKIPQLLKLHIQKKAVKKVEAKPAPKPEIKKKFKSVAVTDFIPMDGVLTMNEIHGVTTKRVFLDVADHRNSYIRSINVKFNKAEYDYDKIAEAVRGILGFAKVDFRKNSVEFLTKLFLDNGKTRTVRSFVANSMRDLYDRYIAHFRNVITSWDINYAGELEVIHQNGIVGLNVIYRLRMKAGGCSKHSHPKKTELNGMFCLSPCAKDNNCFIQCCLHERGLKITSRAVRKACKIANGRMLGFEDADKITKFLKLNVTIFDENKSVLHETVNDESFPMINVILFEKHYYVLINSEYHTKKCQSCGRAFKGKHKCNDKRISYFTSQIQGLLTKPKVNFSAGLKALVEMGCRDKLGDELTKDSIVFDFETFFDEEGEKMHVVYSAGWFDVKKNEYFEAYGPEAINEFMKYVLKEDREMNLVSYNGSGFDNYMIVKYLNQNDIRIDNFVFKNGKYLGVGFGKCQLWDLFLFLNPFSLDKACEGFKIDLKKSVFPHLYPSKWADVEYVGAPIDIQFYPELMKEDVPKYPSDYIFNFKSENLKYLKIDVMATAKLYRAFAVETAVMLEVDINSFMTLSQMSFAKWTNTLKNDQKIELLKDKDKYEFAEKAIYGGRTSPFKHYFISQLHGDIMRNKDNKEALIGLYKKLDDYLCDIDVVSLYPTSMLEKYPIEYSKWMSKKFLDHVQESLNLKQYEKVPFGIFKCTVTPNKKLFIPVIPSKDADDFTKWDLMSSRDQVYTSVDIIEAHKRGYEFQLLKGMMWEKGSNVFSKYINTIYEIKQKQDQYKIEKNPLYNPAQRECAKLLMNSLYGKLCQKRIETESVVVHNLEEAERFFEKYKWLDYDDCGSKKIFIGERRKYERTISKPIHLGAFVLSYSRKIMNDIMDMVDPDRLTDITKSIENSPFYTDTDSLFIHAKHLDRVKSKLVKHGTLKQLGQLDDELEGGKIFEAYFISPKLYCVIYLTKDGKVKSKMRSKGVKGYLLKEDQFRKMYHEKKKEVYKFDMLKKIQRRITKKDEVEGIQKYSIVTMKDCKRTLNKNEWKGRDKVNNVYGVPLGFDKSILMK